MGGLTDLVTAISALVTTVIVVAGAIYAHLQLREAARARKLAFLWEFFQQYRDDDRTRFREQVLRGHLDPITFSGYDRESTLLWQDIEDLEFLGILLERGLVDLDWIRVLFYYSPPRLWSVCKDML